MKFSLIPAVVFSVLLLSSSGVQSKYEVPFIDIPACKTNRITYNKQDTLENRLPYDFYSNAPAEGHLGIGGEHARPLEKKIEPIWINRPIDKVDIGIVFAQNIDYLPKNDERKALGFSFDFTIDGKSYVKTYRKVVKDLTSLFHQRGKEDDNQDDSVLKTSFFLWNERTINLRIDLNGNTIFFLNSVDFYYGDLPKSVWKVYLLPKNEEDRYDIAFNKDNCHRRDDEYTINIGTKGEFTLYSPYGSFYDRRYLEESFGVRKFPDDDYVITDNNIISGGSYFDESYLAPIGTEYLVTRRSSYMAYQENIMIHRIVGDRKPPTFFFPHGKEIRRSYSSDFTSSESYEGEVLISDNKDRAIKTKLVRKDRSPIPEKTCDTFDCILSAYDRRQNERNEEVKVTLFDDVPPFIERDYTDIYLEKGNQISKRDLLSFFHIEDEIDAHPTRKVTKDTYSGRKDKAGNYSFTVEGKDKENNTIEKTRRIHVKESFGEYYLKNSFIKAMEEEIPTKEEIVSRFIQSGRIEDKSYSSITQIEGEELSNSLKPGTYQRKLRLSSLGEEDVFFFFTLTVQEKEKKRVMEEKEEGFFEKIISFFVRIFRAIADFFSSLFSKGETSSPA